MVTTRRASLLRHELESPTAIHPKFSLAKYPMRQLALVIALSGLTPAFAASDTEADRPPNIVFVFADDQRNDTLGCAGHPIVQTPNIDRLASQGVRFQNAFVTTSICWVSRASVLTGMWSRSHGSPGHVDVVNPEAATNIYPTLLRQAGYRTAFFGKWHARMPRGFRNEEHFDQYEGISRDPYFKEMPDGSLRHETTRIGDRAVEFIREQSPDTPFCVNLWFNAGHAEDNDLRPGVGHYPWPRSTDGLYEDRTMPPPALGAPDVFESQPDFLKQSLNRTRYFWRWDTPEKYQANLRAYFRMLTGIDQAVGRVRKVIEEQGLAEHTVIIYSADNGYYMGDRGFAGKWSHYEQSIRVPLIIYDPRLPGPRRGRVLSELALNVDLPATFLDLAGAALPATYQGASLLPLVQGKPATWRADFLAEHLLEYGSQIPKWEGVRGQRYMYARYFEHDHEFLHDLETDPNQLRNFARDPAYTELLEQMRARCDTLADRYGGRHAPKTE